MQEKIEMQIDTVPLSIPESHMKKKLLELQNVSHIYLGQGLIFTPPRSADKDFSAFLQTKNIDKNVYSLEFLRKNNNKENEVYCSARMQELWSLFEEKQKKSNIQNEAFGSFVYEISKNTISQIFSISEKNIETFQCDNLMMALETVFLSVEKTHGKITTIFLPQKYQYSGYSDFFAKINALGSQCKIMYIPEVKNSGVQDLEKISERVKYAEKKSEICLFIDQEHNNNASGYDRNIQQNEDLFTIFSKYKKSCIYFGDIAYKGLKESFLEPYDFVQKCSERNIHAYFYCSFSKLTNYRSSPSFKNILFVTQSDALSVQKLKKVLQKIGRSMGIGTSSQSSEFMNLLIKDEIFLKEVEILRLYLAYIKERIFQDLQNTSVQKYFNENTFGIFRCLPVDIIKKINSGKKQVVTVGERINIWPLGDPEKRKIFIELCSQI